MIPSYIRKGISGWTNPSGKVISHKMSESEIGYRGSKSKYLLNKKPIQIKNKCFVKEQRADGSWFFNKNLGAASNGFEETINLDLAKQLLNKTRSYSTSNSPIQIFPINPWFITGFTDAEGSFMVSITKNENSKLKWGIYPSFAIHIHNKDISLLNQIQKTLGVGNVRKNSKTTALFRVDNLKELQVIINHFDKYPLVSFKASDYIIFKKCYNLIMQKQHLTQKGFEEILSLKYKLNKGLPDNLKKTFPHIIPIERPEYIFINIPNPYWISGFASGDSTFSVSIENSNNKLGKRVRLIFGTCLHIRDKELLIGMANYFYNSFENLNKSVLNKQNKLSDSIEHKYKYNYDSPTTSLLQIKKYSDIRDIIIPFFNKYPILGVKHLDFYDFKLISNLIDNKEHLTQDRFK
uniref:Intronic endonuclease n=1 Tax=Cyclocybe aegerita TaxID=1973307 RepID=Q33639_CYCAE|nr:intronic endonuclease [Cyclocybe aegerita]